MERSAPVCNHAHVDIRRLGAGDEALMDAVSPNFDAPVKAPAATRFLTAEDHHILVAYDGSSAAGFVTGVETTHPDKGTEMFLYELGVGEAFRGRGIGKALVTALAAVARRRGCYGMWVLADGDNDAALATYVAAGAVEQSHPIMLGWEFPEDRD